MSAGQSRAEASRMRRRWVLAFPLAWVAAGYAHRARAEESLPPLRVSIDRDAVDLAAGRLEVKLSRAAARVTLKVLGQSGAVIDERSRVFEAAPPGTPLVMTWAVSPDDPVARIEVFGHDVHGYYKGVALTPWSLSVPHRDVVFETGSAKIRPSEERKLEESFDTISKLLRRHAQLGSITLYVVAHTDRVGSAASNSRLSTRRAKALARWFRKRGVKLPLRYAGLGERMPRVPTADEVPEVQNRRADYWLALSAPRFEKSGIVPAWQKL